MRFATALICALAAFPAAGAPILEQPIDCDLGSSCYIQNYVDADPTSGWSDFACGKLSYDGHKGTDFALPSLVEMRAGVTVRAAAAGTVIGTRDGMADSGLTPATMATIKGRECGNGVAIDHGDGWVTQYCHMRQNSIAVAKGQKVTSGTPLGLVGLSGRTEFPHLHLSLRHGKAVVDPFAPTARETCATPPTDAMWTPPIPYQPGGLVRLGFDTVIPSFQDVKSGAAGTTTLPRTAPAIVLFASGFGSRAGDVVQFSIIGPQGEVLFHQATIDAPKALYFRASGKRLKARSWRTGAYLGTVTLLRNGVVYDQDTLPLTID